MAQTTWLLPASRLETIHDAQGLTVAEILADVGFNCARWAVFWQGQWRELLWPGGPANNQLADSQAPVERILQPYRFGFPVLFPFPNRIQDGVFSWAGRAYRLPVNDPQQRNAIHGLVGDIPWEVLACEPQAATHSVTGRFRLSQHAPERLAWWPSDFQLTLTWSVIAEASREELRSAELTAQVEITNCGNNPLPFGLGFHPYFAVNADNADVVIQNVRQPGAELRRWELHELIPTGRLLPLGQSDWRLVEAMDAEPLPQWDDAFRLLGVSQDSPLVVHLRDRQRQFMLVLEAGTAFRDLVLFVPPHRQAVCIEPYTCVTNAINLYTQGVASGLRVLVPGQSWQTHVRVRFVPNW